jgi:sRNA-binding carbon storage regulator CsrA
MLTVNVREGQKVYVGDNTSVTVKDIDVGDNSVLMNMTSGDQSNDFMMSINSSFQLIPNVVLVLMRVMEGSNKVAHIGFDAPRHITIAGAWTKKGKQMKANMV